MAEKEPLPQTSPESVGIPSGAVGRFLKKLEEDGLCMYSVMMLRHGKLAKESFGSMTDDYFGTLKMNFVFDRNTVTVVMRRSAEWFLDDYDGFASGECQNS